MNNDQINTFIVVWKQLLAWSKLSGAIIWTETTVSGVGSVSKLIVGSAL